MSYPVDGRNFLIDKQKTFPHWHFSGRLAAWSVVLVCLLVASSAMAQMATGTYTGDGTDNRAISGLGFAPHIVLVKSNERKPTVMTVDAMGDGWGKVMNGTDAASDLDFASLDADGFTIRASDLVNKIDDRYDWVAFAKDEGRVVTGSYLGTGTQGSLQDIGFRPEYVIVIPFSTGQVIQRNTLMPEDYSLPFGARGSVTNHITTFTDQGFVLGDDSDVNGASEQYYYAAWLADPDRTVVGTYVGNAIDNRDLNGVGLKPSWVVTKSESSKSGVHLGTPLNGTGMSQYFSSLRNQTDRIQELLTDGFQLGRRKEVNENDKIYYWTAFGALSDISVNLTTDRDTAQVGNTVVSTTSVTNLGPDPAASVLIEPKFDVALNMSAPRPPMVSMSREQMPGPWSV